MLLLAKLHMTQFRIFLIINYLGFWAGSASAAPATQPMVVERWGIFEIALPGPADGNPFVDVTLSASFTTGNEHVDCAGFYDGDGVYRVRFQPDQIGDWKYLTHSNRTDLDGKAGDFAATAPSVGNHGPVAVKNTFHFAYADQSPYFQIGTTCYNWAMQPDAVEDQTLVTLKDSPFNKVRMFVMPSAEGDAAQRFPFVGKPPKDWDFTRFDPKFFQAIERRVGQLRDLGIQADMILFNPYDKGRWGFDNIGQANDDRYARYVVARFAAYRNVWWSLSNEFDLMKTKTDSDWDRLFQIVESSDPYHRLRSIHHSMRLYDYNKPWVTHASLQNGSAVEDFGRAELYRDVFNKPIVMDEVKYEGNFPQRWGQLSGEEMTARFWHGTIAGVYVGHGEVFTNPNGTVWTNDGGVLKGQSPPRIAFLKKILDSAPPEGIDPIDKWQDVQTAGKAGDYYLVYFGKETPTSWLFELPKAGLKEGERLHVDVLDTWEMTTTPADGEFEIIPDGRYRFHSKGMLKVTLPGKPYIALRITRTGAE